MAKENNQKIVLLKKEHLCLKCEWNACENHESYNMEAFIKHIDCHLLNIKEMNNINCPWLGCSSVANTREDFLRHIYYHVFHTKIKNIGANLLHRKGVIENGCTLGRQGKNLIPEIKENFRCGWIDCQETFTNPEYYYCHVNRHAENSPKGNKPKGGVLCLWSGCDCHFQSQYKLRDHLRSHTQEKLAACPSCGALFSNRTKLFDHIKRQIPVGMQDYQCSHCSKWFSLERLLRDHMRTHVNHYKCPYCDMTCPSPSSLNAHIKYRHTEEKPYSCEYCDYSCKSETDLRRHINTHNVEAPYKCSDAQCNFATRSLQSLTNHNRKIHEGSSTCRYKCHICEKKFSRGAYLTQHLIKQHKFRWPAGHSRFRYKCDDDGFYRLQTVRYESIELIQEMMDNRIAETPIENISEELEHEQESMKESIISETPDNTHDTYLISIEQSEDGSVIMQTIVQDGSVTSYPSENVSMETFSAEVV